jgi:hypothetical protein
VTDPNDGGHLFGPTLFGRDAGLFALNTQTLQVDWKMLFGGLHGEGPVQISSAGDVVYAAVNSDPPTLSSVSTATHAVTARSTIAVTLHDLALLKDGNTLFGKVGRGPLVAVTVATGETQQLVDSPAQTNFLSLDSATGLIVIASSFTDQVQGIDVATGQTIGTTPLLAAPLYRTSILRLTSQGRQPHTH